MRRSCYWDSYRAERGCRRAGLILGRRFGSRLLFAPGRHDAVDAGVGDELAEMLVAMRGGGDHGLAHRGVVAEELDGLVHVGGVLDSGFDVREGILEIGHDL